MVIYEVSATVDPQLVATYERYMTGTHIPDVLASGCFEGAWLLATSGNRYRIVYQLSDDATLQRYLAEHAPKLRADFTGHFPAGVELSREVWEVVTRW